MTTDSNMTSQQFFKNCFNIEDLEVDLTKLSIKEQINIFKIIAYLCESNYRRGIKDGCYKGIRLFNEYPSVMTNLIQKYKYGKSLKYSPNSILYKENLKDIEKSINILNKHYSEILSEYLHLTINKEDLDNG